LVKRGITSFQKQSRCFEAWEDEIDHGGAKKKRIEKEITSGQIKTHGKKGM
jgi:hypothetical protein